VQLNETRAIGFSQQRKTDIFKLLNWLLPLRYEQPETAAAVEGNQELKAYRSKFM
jgi:hypothetical protein